MCSTVHTHIFRLRSGIIANDSMKISYGFLFMFLSIVRSFVFFRFCGDGDCRNYMCRNLFGGSRIVCVRWIVVVCVNTRYFFHPIELYYPILATSQMHNKLTFVRALSSSSIWFFFSFLFIRTAATVLCCVLVCAWFHLFLGFALRVALFLVLCIVEIANNFVRRLFHNPLVCE